MDKLIVGEKYGRLTVLENHHPKDEAVCRCECGNIKIARATNIFYGGTRSCGCLFSEGNNFKHGDRRNHQKNRLYGIWKGIRERCNTPSHKSYDRYGGRGITLCEEWNDYTKFREWSFNNGYADDLTIDRINVDGDYEPNNCRWVSYKVQANNRRNNHFIEIDGTKHTLAEWSDISGIGYSVIICRLQRGWNERDAVFKPLRRRKHE